MNLAANRHPGTADMRAVVRNIETDEADFSTLFHQASLAFDGIVLPPRLTGFFGSKEAGQKAIFGTEGALSKRVQQSLPWINTLFSSLKFKFSRLVVAADLYVSQRQWEGNIYDPHLGLFVTFLHLFGSVQRSLNKLTEKHLNFYYETILGIGPLPASADVAHLVIEPDPGESVVSLQSGEELVAKDPANGNDLLFLLHRNTAVSGAAIKELRTSYIRADTTGALSDPDKNEAKELQFFTGNYPAPSASTFMKDGPGESWPLFGEDQNNLPANSRTMDEAEPGFVIGSPMLYLRDGKRQIQLIFYIGQASANTLKDYVAIAAKAASGNSAGNEEAFAYELLDNSFIISITGETGWLPVKRYAARYDFSAKDAFIELNFVLETTDDAVGSYNRLVHGAELGLTTPAIKLVININSFHNSLRFLMGTLLERISLRVDVSGSRQINLRNNFGPVSTTIPFQIFGPIPSVGSYLDIISPAIFNHFTKKYSVCIDWQDLPKDPGGFKKYFEAYDNGVDNDSFKVSMAAIINGRAFPEPQLQEVNTLFSVFRDDAQQQHLKDRSVLGAKISPHFDFINDAKPASLFEIDENPEGVLRIQLIAPQDGFGHKLYPQIFPLILANNARFFLRKKDIPNLPYLPVVDRLTVDYTLQHSEVLRSFSIDDDDMALKMVHLYPAGYKTAYPSKGNPVLFLPEFIRGGNLFMGLSNVLPGQELSLLFELEEKNFPHTLQDVGAVNWYYLQQDSWQAFKPEEILSDTTDRFTHSGIVTLKIRQDVDGLENTSVNPELYWLRASVPSGKTAQSRVVAIFTQGVTVMRKIDAHKTEIVTPLPAGSIYSFFKKMPEIAGVYQPFTTIGGSHKENVHQYRLRVSERLRHKNRAITMHDISQIILQHFPQILMVRCFSSGTNGSDLVVPDANIQIIVLPRELEKNAALGKAPKVNLATLFGIKNFINQRISSFAKTEVGNPVYEKIKVICQIKVRRSTAENREGYFISLLNKELQQFITPWLYDNTKAVQIGSKIYISQILNFIQSRPYITGVTGFSVLHFYKKYDVVLRKFNSMVNDSSQQHMSYMQASRQDAILFGSTKNLISIMNSGYMQSVPSGIGELEIGQELPIKVDISNSLNGNLLPATLEGNKNKEATELLNFKFNA